MLVPIDSAAVLPSRSPIGARAVYLASLGDSTDPRTFSGIPFHMAAAGMRTGTLAGGLRLGVGGRPRRMGRWMWNLRQLLRGRGIGGYQYSRGFLEMLWSQSLPALRGATVVNLFQLYPPSVIADNSICKISYVDMTLRQLFEAYEVEGRIGRPIAREALELERQGYLSARVVGAHSRWAADSLHSGYGIPWERIRIAVPGANLDASAYAEWERRAGLRAENFARILRLVWVGKEWHRKGLDRLIGGIAAGRRHGLQAHLTVIGCPRRSVPAHLRSIPGITWLGFIDKSAEPLRFMNLVASADVGCLLSRAEAGGIALREFHALGLPVLGTTAGGSSDHVLPGASIAVPAEAGCAEIGNLLLRLNRSPEALRDMRRVAWRLRKTCLWEHTLQQLSPVLVAP